MPHRNILDQVDALRAAIQSRGPLSEAVLRKVNYKFRLEWNYTSNSMEGNSLSRPETRSVMIGNITIHGKPIKDVLEMKGHDEVILSILKMGAGELQLSESRIREIHRGIMHEEDPERAHNIGKWKTQDNHVINPRGEKYDFTPHAEVPDAMHQLLNQLSAEREKMARGDKDALHPALLAFRFHLDYVSIHPFYDGNGRTARILTNLILIAYGYPPVWIKEEERDAYYQYLADVQAYGGSPDVFYEFMAGLLLRSQQLVMDAVAGKDIEERSDLDKKLTLLKSRIGIIRKNLEGLTYSPILVDSVIQSSIVEFAKAWEKRLQDFDPLFERRLIYISANGDEFFGQFGQHTRREATNALKDFYTDTLLPLLKKDINIRSISLKCYYSNLVAASQEFQMSGGDVNFYFQQNRYELFLNNKNKTTIIKLSKFYDEPLSEEEIAEIVHLIGTGLYNDIEEILNNETEKSDE